MNKVFFGDCRDSMRKLIADGVRVNTCVTSPPYFGLRDYGVDGQLGLEATPQEFVSNMVEVFRLVRELLADDGTLWLNLGDSYAGSGVRSSNPGGKTEKQSTNVGSFVGRAAADVTPRGFKPKDLIGIPWRVAFALQADGWYLRQDIIWSKPNPMPESVTDRCTKAHEYMFLLSKSERYYFDNEAIKEMATDPQAIKGKNQKQREAGKGFEIRGGLNSQRPREMRNKRDVWTVPTQPYSEAHFATFPPALIEPCILAGSPDGGIVLDPFMGSGTTAQVSQFLGRKWIGCELNPAYADLQHKRTAQQGMALA